LRPLEVAGRIQLPRIPSYAQHNAHIFFVVCASREERTALIEWLRTEGIEAVFHYQALHASPYYRSRHDGRPLPEADRYSDCLLRLPLYFDLTPADVGRVSDAIHTFYRRRISVRTGV
jgi:dTDP-4-amino-4,6-dideoxygalactose transaminase